MLKARLQDNLAFAVCGHEDFLIHISAGIPAPTKKREGGDKIEMFTWTNATSPWEMYCKEGHKFETGDFFRCSTRPLLYGFIIPQFLREMEREEDNN